MGATLSDYNVNIKSISNMMPELERTSSRPILFKTMQLRVVVVGDAKTGKTSIINQFVNGSFSHRYLPTSDIHATTYCLKTQHNVQIDLFLYEVPGCMFSTRSVHQLYTRLEWMNRSGINGFIAVYDVNREQSYINMQNTLNILLKIYYDKHGIKIPTLILGNKTDLSLPFEQCTTKPPLGVHKWCQYHAYNDRYHIAMDESKKKILRGYKLLISGYLRRNERILNMSRKVLLSGQEKKIPHKVDTLCLDYLCGDHIKYSMVQQQVSAQSYSEINKCIQHTFIDILVDRYQHTLLDKAFA